MKVPTGYGKMLVTVIDGKLNQIEPTPLYKNGDLTELAKEQILTICLLYSIALYTKDENYEPRFPTVS